MKKMKLLGIVLLGTNSMMLGKNCQYIPGWKEKLSFGWNTTSLGNKNAKESEITKLTDQKTSKESALKKWQDPSLTNTEGRIYKLNDANILKRGYEADLVETTSILQHAEKTVSANNAALENAKNTIKNAQQTIATSEMTIKTANDDIATNKTKKQQLLAKIDTQQKKIEELEKDTHGKNLSNEIGIITTKIEDYSQCDPKTGR